MSVHDQTLPTAAVAEPNAPSSAVVAQFDTEDALLRAARAVREEGYRRTDALTPFPVHGIDEALGIPRSRLGYIVCVGAALGLASAILLQWWTGAVDYPLVIGGKPFFAFEFAMPIMFELTVLFSAFFTVIGMFALNGLPRFYHPTMEYTHFNRGTDDRFLLVIESSDPKFHPDHTVRFLNSVGAKNTELV